MNPGKTPTEATVFNRISERWGWYASLGVLLIVLGVLAISSLAVTTFATAVALGLFVAASGVIETIHGFRARRRKDGSALFHILVGILSFVVGVVMIRNPGVTALTLSLLVASYFLAMGLFRVITAVADRYPNWGLELALGCLSLLIGFLLFIGWPATSLVLIGFLVGIELLSRGFALLSLALAVRRRLPQPA